MNGIVGVAMAIEVKSWGRGGVSAVQRAAGASRSTIRRGLDDLVDDASEGSDHRVRAPGGGRKKAEVTDPELVDALDTLIEPETRGDLESPLRWTTTSTRNLAAELTEMGHAVSHLVVAEILRSLKYSLQGTRKTLDGRHHPDWDARLRCINTLAGEFLASGDPVVSVDTRKEELVGRYAQAGQEWHPQGEPVEVSTYDFPSQADGKAIPFGVYDLTENSAWVSVGIDHDTSVFAVATIDKWWQQMGKGKIPRRPQDPHHRRRRRIQRTPPLAVEVRTRPTGQGNRTRHHRLPLPTRNQQGARAGWRPARPASGSAGFESGQYRSGRPARSCRSSSAWSWSWSWSWS
jgi:hypothetical protein